MLNQNLIKDRLFKRAILPRNGVVRMGTHEVLPILKKLNGKSTLSRYSQENLFGKTENGWMSRREVSPPFPQEPLQEWTLMWPGQLHHLPVYQNKAFPFLKSKPKREGFFIYKWLFLGGLEADITGQVDEIASKYELETRYRWFYPYLEVKMTQKTPFNGWRFSDLRLSMQTLAHFLVSGCLVAEGPGVLKMASQSLKETVALRKIQISVEDYATKGMLYSLIASPENQPFLNFFQSRKISSVNIRIEGLEKYWATQEFFGEDTVHVFCQSGAKDAPETKTSIVFPLRGHEVRCFAAEFASFEILKYLNDDF